MPDTLSLSIRSAIKDANNNTLRAVIASITASFTESVSFSDVITAGASDVDVSPNRLDNIDYLVIETDQEITVKLNGTGNFAIPIRPLTTGEKGILLICTKDLTSIHVAVPGTEDANINILAGYIST